MKRRGFLGACAVVGGAVLLGSEQKPAAVLPKDIFSLIAGVQQHMFPEGSTLPSAGEFNATHFLQETVMHPLYDRDIRKFVIEGAEELQYREKQQFLTYDMVHRERALRAYEKTAYGSEWLDRVMLLSLEGLLSDPIYGGNIHESGWISLQTRGGEPRPVVRYAGK